MCQKKPGPRCAAHVRRELAEASRKIRHLDVYGDKGEQENAKKTYAPIQREFYKTPTGQRELAAVIDNTTNSEERRQLSNLLSELKLERKAEAIAGKLADGLEAEVDAEHEREESSRVDPPHGEHHDPEPLKSFASVNEKARAIQNYEEIPEKARAYMEEVEKLAKEARKKKDYEAMRLYGRDLSYASDRTGIIFPGEQTPHVMLGRELHALKADMSRKGLSIYYEAERLLEKRKQDAKNRELLWKSRAEEARGEVDVAEIKQDLLRTARRKASSSQGVKQTDFPFTLGHKLPENFSG